MIRASSALDQLESIRAYIAEFDPRAADCFRDRILIAGESVTALPNHGRPLLRGGRQLSTGWPYVIRNRVRADDVVIQMVRHGARRRTGKLP